MADLDFLEDSTATLDGEDVPAASNTETAVKPAQEGPCCPQCESPMVADQMVCRRCGFYPSLGISVELDPEWEAVNDPETPPEAPRSPLEELSSVVPAWAWVILGSNVAILVLSVLARLMVPAESTLYIYWGIAQLVAGIALVVVLHVTCFVMVASSDTNMGIFDLIVSPLKPWFRICQKLPQRQWLLTGGTNGITLAICAVLVVGGIPWERLWDWGVEAPANSSLVKAIANAAGNGPANDDGLEAAVTDFAGEAGNVSGGKRKPPAKPKEPAPRKTTDCLIVGYLLDDLEQIRTVLIATESSGRLVYAGEVVPTLDERERAALKHKLESHRTGAPFVKTGRAASWVQPRFPCRVSYTEQTKTGRLVDIKWEDLLPELDLSWAR